MALRHLALMFLIALLAAPGAGAKEPLPHRYAEISVDSGLVRNHGSERATTFSQTVAIDGVDWIRLFFSHAALGELEGRSDGTVLRITSLEDGAVQLHTAESLRQWRHASAFFNGDAVRVELIADPDAPPSRIRIDEVMVSTPGVADKSICGATDDRTLLNDARVARIVPVGCTAWLIDDAQGCFLTAGHCVGDSFDVVEFNVPLSDANGAVNHPAPQDQYPVDLASVQFDQTMIGNDWSYFGTFPNGQTLLTPLEVQGATYSLGMPPATASGETIRITGHGTTSGTQGTPLSWNQVGTTHIGPLANVSGTALRYATDTTGGNSGSAIFNEDTGAAIGIHTNAGCGAGGGSNSGTGLNNAGVQNALANPAGICANGPPVLRVTLNGTIPDPLPPLVSNTFQVDIVDRAGAPAAITSATLVYDAGGGDQTAALSAVGGGTWEATLPGMACGTEVTFRVDVEATNGSTVRHPYAAFSSADRRYRRQVATTLDATFHDDFETDMGWTVDDDAGLTAGSWERGLPAGYGMRGDPPWDGDSSGSLYATALPGGNTDVDGGSTRLVSPTLDASVGTDPHISYWRWWDDAGASDDTFVVEVSDDDGGSWTTLEAIGPNVLGSWVYSSFRITDFVTPNDQFRIRFTATDAATGHVVEAAVDGVTLSNNASGIVCGTPLFSDGFESGNTSAWSATIP